MSRAALVSMIAACTGASQPTLGEHAGRLDEDARQIVANISYQDIPTNLIANGDFEDYRDANVPDGWAIDEVYGYRGMYTPADGWRGLGVQLVRNARAQHMLRQTVQVKPNQRYTAQLVYHVRASDSSRGGLYVIDPAGGAVIASDTINRPSNGWRIASVTFDSGERTELAVAIGYPSGMNGTVIYDGVSLFEEAPEYSYRFQTRYRDVIGVADLPVDALVPQLSDYVTTLLAAPRPDRVAHLAAYADELPYYLARFLDAPDGTGRAEWCQKTSLALSELLEMYGVRTRQVHSTSIQHQFLEYFDGAKWVAFDPYYGIRYVLRGVRLAVDDTVTAGMDQVSIEVPTQHHVFLLELGYLRPIWAAGGFVRGIEM